MGFGEVVLHFTHDEAWPCGTNLAIDREGEVQGGAGPASAARYDGLIGRDAGGGGEGEEALCSLVKAGTEARSRCPKCPPRRVGGMFQPSSLGAEHVL
jgi:hypothetical protein